MKFTVHSTGARLRKGDIVDMGSEGHCEVVFVNECRARVRPLTRRQVTMETLNKGTVEFDKAGAPFNISPNSECRIIRRA